PNDHSGKDRNPKAHFQPRSNPTVAPTPNVRPGRAPSLRTRPWDTTRGHIPQPPAISRRRRDPRHPGYKDSRIAGKRMIGRADLGLHTTDRTHPGWGSTRD